MKTRPASKLTASKGASGFTDEAPAMATGSKSRAARVDGDLHRHEVDEPVVGDARLPVGAPLHAVGFVAVSSRTREDLADPVGGGDVSAEVLGADVDLARRRRVPLDAPAGEVGAYAVAREVEVGVLAELPAPTRLTPRAAEPVDLPGDAHDGVPLL